MGIYYWPTMVIAALLVMLAAREPATAATVETTITPEMAEIGCTVRLNGEIVDGDLERLSSVLSIAPEYDVIGLPNFAPGGGDLYGFPLATHRLCLNSRGGSFLEALEIAERLTDFRDTYNKPGILTGIARGDVCESACGLIFKSGRYSWVEDIEAYWRPNQIMHPEAVLGFHSPIITLPNRDFARAEVYDIWGIGMRAVSLLTQQINSGTMFVNERLLSDMLETVPPGMIYVETVADATRWGINVLFPDQGLLSMTDAEAAANHCRNLAPVASGRFQIAATQENKAQVIAIIESSNGKQQPIYGVVGGFREEKLDAEYSCVVTRQNSGHFISEYGHSGVEVRIVEGLLEDFLPPKTFASRDDFNPPSSGLTNGRGITAPSGLTMFAPETRLAELFARSIDPENVSARHLICDNRDIPGFDLLPDGIRNTTLAECASACEGNPKCKGFSLVKSSKRCWLKSEAICWGYLGSEAKPIENIDVITGVIRSK